MANLEAGVAEAYNDWMLMDPSAATVCHSLVTQYMNEGRLQNDFTNDTNISH